ncbi:hypothetical protein AAA799B03_00839 [Marine Group I thaumarchaeote SCGC AAA799-B03]|uniref:Uncharacterized protein n=1 Tax=Marine Group I thaumarchaeote SCGC AAA799-B03 TaxID=1502289 RepID=A0A087S778_9ARCH|nr:hypothetical protein AAA799B03_00839 [Marine Group I thaumarchaeote SCGC AAA799-B03]
MIINAIISFNCKNAYRTISETIIPKIIEGPPGLTTIMSSFLFISFTAMFLFFRNLIRGGVVTKTTKNAITHETNAGITKSINI